MASIRILLATAAILLLAGIDLLVGHHPTAVAQPIRVDRHGDALPVGALARLGTTRFRHGALVLCAAFSPDGKKLATGDDAGGVHLWDAATGKKLHAFTGHEGPVYSVAFSPNGALLASASRDFSVRLWDAIKTKPLAQFGDGQNKNLSKFTRAGLFGYTLVAFTPDGATLLATRMGSAVFRWDVATGKETSPEPGGLWVGMDFKMAMSPDGKSILAAPIKGRNPFSGKLDSEVKFQLWDLAEGKPRLSFAGHTDNIASFAFSPNGQQVATASREKTVGLWDRVTGKVQKILSAENKSEMVAVAFTSDGKTLAGLGTDHKVTLWDVVTGKMLRGIQTPDATQFAFAPDGKTLATFEGSAILLWEAATGKLLTSYPGHQAAVMSLAFSPDNQTLASGGSDGQVLLWNANVAPWPVRLSKEDLGRVKTVAYAPGQPLILVNTEPKSDLMFNNHDLILWDPTTGKRLQKVSANSDEIGRPSKVFFTSDGKTLIVNGSAVPISGLEKIRYLLPPSDNYHSSPRYSYSPQATVVAVERRRGIEIIDIVIKEKRCLLEDSDHNFGDFSLTPDGNRLTAGDPELRFRIWDTKTGKLLYRSTKLPSLVRTIVYSADGRSLALGLDDGSVSLVETATNQERQRLQGHVGPIWCLAFTSDNRTLASGSVDSTILLWEATGCVPDAKAPKTKELPALWAALASKDAVVAHRAMGRLLDATEEVPSFLAARFKELAHTDPKKLDQLFAAVSDKRPAFRAESLASLEKLGDQIEPFLREELGKNLAADHRQRLEKLLQHLQEETWTPDRLRSLRALEVLERLGTLQARYVLEALAHNAPGTWLRREAAASAARVTNRRAALTQK